MAYLSDEVTYIYVIETNLRFKKDELIDVMEIDLNET